MAKRRKYDSAAQLTRGIKAYFARIERHNAADPDSCQYPTWPGLCLALDVTYDTIAAWRRNEGGQYPGYAEALDKAFLQLQASLEQLALENGKKTSIAAFLLKQKQYGGYSDRPASAEDTRRVQVDIQGVDSEEAFN